MFRKFLIISLFFIVTGSLDVAISRYQMRQAKMLLSNTISWNK